MTDWPGSPQATAGELPDRPQRVLVADDNDVNRMVAVAMLGKLGYAAATANDGQEAVERVTESLQTGHAAPYAAVLMDASMPVLDGFAASRQIISRWGSAAPPIIALTASVGDEDRQRCVDAGMAGFLPKPLHIDELAEALARVAVSRPASSPSADAAGEAANAAANNVTNAATIDTFADEACSPHGSTSTTTALVLMDWSRLAQFREFDDLDRSMTREVIALFTRDAPSRMDDIRAALALADSAALSRATHALKGAASNVGAEALSDACLTLEQSCLQGQWPADAAQQVALVGELTEQTRAALKAWAAQP